MELTSGSVVALDFVNFSFFMVYTSTFLPILLFLLVFLRACHDYRNCALQKHVLAQAKVKN